MTDPEYSAFKEEEQHEASRADDSEAVQERYLARQVLDGNMEIERALELLQTSDMLGRVAF